MKTPPPRPKKLLLFMSAPIVYASLLMGALGLLVFLIWTGSSADGVKVRIKIESQCLKDSAKLIEARAEEIGLGELSLQTENNLLQIDAVLPDMENAEKEIPLLLIQGGYLSFFEGDRILAKNVVIKDASVTLGESGMPYARIILETKVRRVLQKHILGDPMSFTSIYLDGVKIIDRPNTNKLSDAELRLIYSKGGMRVQMKQTADWAIVLKHGPLPCQHSIRSTSRL